MGGKYLISFVIDFRSSLAFSIMGLGSSGLWVRHINVKSFL